MKTKNKPAARRAIVGKPGSNRTGLTLTEPWPGRQAVDVFAIAKQTYTIPEMWRMLQMPGEPKVGMNCSPFREERKPSFSIYDGGRRFKDHGGNGEQGDVIAFLQAATDSSHAEIRDFLIEHLGIDRRTLGEAPSLMLKVEGGASPLLLQKGGEPTFSPSDSTCFNSETSSPPDSKCLHVQTVSPPDSAYCNITTSRPIAWPSELAIGSEEAWSSFAKLRGYSYPAVWLMAQAGILRFTVINKHKCLAVTDSERRAAEIRRVDGGLFGSGSKAYPLKGVDKQWLVGAALLSDTADVLITEGSTDLLTAYDLYYRYRKEGGQRQWCPVALLGSKCRTLDPGLLDRMSGRHVRLVPDGDDDGDAMRNTWSDILAAAGATVDVLTMPRGKDLSDERAKIQPEEVFA